MSSKLSTSRAKGSPKNDELKIRENYQNSHEEEFNCKEEVFSAREKASN